MAKSVPVNTRKGDAPAKAPKIAVAVLVENGGDRLNATGGALAAPIGRATIAAALQEAA